MDSLSLAMPQRITISAENCDDLTNCTFDFLTCDANGHPQQLTAIIDNNNAYEKSAMDAGVMEDLSDSDIISSNASDEEQEDLKSLTWLTELKNLTNLPPAQNDNQIVQKPCDPPSQRFEKFINQVQKIKENYLGKSMIYQTEAGEKPPYNYAQIIAMAMLDEGRMTLKQICDWIEDHFAYYRTHRNWNNSIRHNLSLNFFFSKVARGKNEKGKGGYWELAVCASKTLRKRVRNRKKKNQAMLKSCRTSLKRKHPSMRSVKSSKMCNEIGSDREKIAAEDVFMPTLTSDFIERSSEDFSGNNVELTEIEIIEEQQNINNIIDEANNAILIANNSYGSPKVIVQEINQYQFTSFNQINFDENELSEIICLNDQDLIDDLFEYSNNVELM